MRNGQKKDFVCMDCLKNETGFSFVSLFLMITLICMIMPLSNYLLQISKDDIYDRELTVNEFFRFIRDDLIKSYDYDVVNKSTLQLHQENGEIVTIHQYGNLIRRQVKGLGHEIYFRDVKEIEFYKLETGIKIVLTIKEGMTYERKFAFYNET